MPQTPLPSGNAGGNGSGQADRFTSSFNPAFSFVVDGVIDYLHSSDDAVDSGAHSDLRALEILSQAWVDPTAWAYFVASTDGDQLTIEEAAVHYTGLGGHDTLRLGKFFIDFGKQMQTHVHELRTLERPLVLRTFLGEEIKGIGVEWDSWTTVGDTGAIRWSLGGFQDLTPEEGATPDPDVTVAVEDRKDFGDFDFTARVTGFTDVGTNGVLQLGASARYIPSFTATQTANGGGEAADLANAVYGVDVTYGWTSDDGIQTWTFGGEYLVDTGDTTPRFDTLGDSDPTNDALTGYSSHSLQGFFVWVDHGFDRLHSAGLQYSEVELPLPGEPRASEIEAYYTHSFSEFGRVRLVASTYQTDEPDGDSVRFAIQYTAVIGAHGHGINW